MAKQINYLLIAQGLTGDSSVQFFPTPELAKQAFDNLTQPLIKVCMDNGCNPDDEDVFYPTKDGKGVRFNSGELETLDELICENNEYYEWNTITAPDDVTHYIAEFNEYVDESSISFHTKDEATTKYNDLIDQSIQIAKDHHGVEINRYNQSTWETENGTVFSEPIDTTVNHTDAFFGYSDVYYTYRCGQIL
jgi:hypothetical protein